MFHLMVESLLFVVIFLVLVRKVGLPVQLPWLQIGIPLELGAAYAVAEILSKRDSGYDG